MAQGVKPGLAKLHCEWCGNEFQAKTSWQKFCTRRCAWRTLEKISPARRRETYKNWLENKRKNEPEYFKELYLRRRKNEVNYREKCRIQARNYHRKNRIKVLDYYGGKCVCCGESLKEFLCIDHINGGGTKHRKELKSKHSSMVQWIIRNNYPKEYRVLCHNCNQSLGYYGYCPHKKL